MINQALPFPYRRELALMRTFFFVYIGGTGLFIPFINLFLNYAGMNGTQIGVLAMLAAICGLAAAPIWGRMSDRSGHLRRLLQIGLALSALSALVLGMQQAFWGFCLMVCLHALMNAGNEPLSTALGMRIVIKNRSSGFGDVRRWGSLGWAIFVLGIGPLLQRNGLGVIFPAYAAAFILSAVLLIPVDDSTARNLPKETEKDTANVGYRRIAFTLIHNRGLLALFFSLLTWGIMNAGWRQFWQIYMDQLGAEKSLIAVGAMMGAAVEMPAMLWTDRWLKRFGARWALLAACLVDMVRLVVVLLFPFPATIVVVMGMGGIAFSLRTIGTVTYILERTPAVQFATMLAVFTVTLYNLIVILGAPISGIFFDKFGAYWLYGLGAVGSLFAWMILFYGDRGTKRLVGATQ